VLICVILVAGAVTLNMRADVSRERGAVLQALTDRAESSARSIAEEVVTPSDQIVDIFSDLGGQLAGATSPRACSAALQPIQRLAGSWGHIVVVDRAGTLRCAAGEHAAQVGRPLYRGVLEVRALAGTGRLTTTRPFPDPLLGRMALASGAALPGGRALLMVFDTQRTLAPVEPSAQLTTVVVDGRTGTVLMHAPARAGLVGRAASEVDLDAVVGRQGGLHTADGVDGSQLVTAQRVPGTDLWVVVGKSRDAAYAPVRASLERNAALGGLLVLVVTAMGLMLQRGVAVPARRLRQAIAALADDPHAPPAPTAGPLELEAVARAFNGAAEARRRADGLTRALVEHATDLLLVVDGRGTLTYVAPAAHRLLGAEVGDSPLRLARLVHLSDRERLLMSVHDWLRGGGPELRTELRVRDLGGQVHHLDVHAQDLRQDPDVQGIVLAARDDTDRKRAEEDLAFRARHDSLTGLANRARILDELSSRLLDADDSPVAVLFVDLDRFKLINDSHGHAVGDQVLVALADRLFGLTGPGDVVGRLGGDEFVLVAPSAGTAQDAMRLADRVRGALEGSITVAQRELFVSGSVGVAFGDVGDNAATVLRNADTAMYRAKDLGRNCAALYDEEMRQEARRLLRTEVDLHRALERDELVVHYQPVVSLGRGHVLGVEALVRWQHPSRGLVPPSEFIPVAEETGLVVPVGRLVLERACAFAAAEPSVGYVSVNISPRQLAQPDVVSMVRGVLRETGLAAERLCLEVTETLLVQDADAATLTLRALHHDGVRVALDDFGTGWASLTYLQRFPVDTIKLDRSFVSRVTDDPGAAAIVASLIQLAHSIGLTVTAEGVESHAQAEFLRSNRCDLGQGYLFGRPVPAPELTAEIVARGASSVPAPRTGLVR